MRSVQRLVYLALLPSLVACADRPKDHSARYATQSAVTSGSGRAPGSNSPAPQVGGRSGNSPTSPSPSSPPAGGGRLQLDPSGGHPSGGELLVVSGGSFKASSQVTVGGRAATVVEQTASWIAVQTPAGTGNAEVAVVTDGNRESGSTLYVYAPVTTAEAYHFRPETDRWLIQAVDADANGQPDLEQALADATNSAGNTGFPAAQVLLTALRTCSSLYRNQPDGEPLPGGAPLSFQTTAPMVGDAPAPGGSAVPSSKLDHNVMALRGVGYLGGGLLTSGTMGAAQFENQDNTRINNNSASSALSGAPLGVFPDALVHFWNLTAIPPSRRTAESFGEELGFVLAHEIGHSIGLDHVETRPAAGVFNVMSASATLDTANVYAFDDATFNSLLGWLPGTNRCTHRLAWTPRRLLEACDVAVLGRVMGAQGDVLELQVDQVLAGQARLGYQRVAGLDPERASAQLEPGTPALLFLRQTPAGLALADLGPAGGVDMTQRDPNAWAELIADHAALAQQGGAEWLEGCAELLVRSLDAADARIRLDAWADLATSPDVVAALTPGQVGRVVEGLRAPAVAERILAAQVLIHRGEPGLAAPILEAALSEDEPLVLSQLAGALETGLGLDAAADRVEQTLSLRPEAAQARGVVLLAWLQDGAAVDRVTATLDAGQAAPLLSRAAPSLSRSGLTLPGAGREGRGFPLLAGER